MASTSSFLRSQSLLDCIEFRQQYLSTKYNIKLDLKKKKKKQTCFPDITYQSSIINNYTETID